MNWDLVLHRVAPMGNPKVLAGVASGMPAAVTSCGLSNRRRVAGFLGECAHESDGFKTTLEYASGAAYEGRRSLGNIYPGDGVRFRGRGVIQLTGRANYAAVSQALGIDFLTRPDLLSTFPWALKAAEWFWSNRHLNALCDDAAWTTLTYRINGGMNGQASRLAFIQRALSALPAQIG
jgi:putative chitinase